MRASRRERPSRTPIRLPLNPGTWHASRPGAISGVQSPVNTRGLPPRASLLRGLLLAAIFLLLGVAILPTYGKGIAGWYRVHAALAMVGGILAIAAIAIVLGPLPSGAIRDAWDAHVALGLIVLLLLLCTLGAGVYRKWAGGHKGQVRTAHLWLGRALVVLVLANIVLGLSAVGVLG